LLANPTVREAAEACKVPEVTIYKWLREREGFREEYESRKRALVDDAVNFLQIRMQEASKVITELMSSSETPAQVRLNAARTVFEYVFKAIELHDVIERLEALEKAMEE
jgi:polyhydroxyalkanoate synthesis regulator phasin